MIAEKSDRKIENLRFDIEDARDAASHAHRFNLYLSNCVGGAEGAAQMDLEIPQVTLRIICKQPAQF